MFKIIYLICTLPWRPLDVGSSKVFLKYSVTLNRNPADQKPFLDLPILGYDINVMDSKDSKKSYCIKISHPSQETHYFATDSRVSIERWIEVLSLAATGRLDVIAPYPPYFCAERSGDELKSRSRESLLSSEVRLCSVLCFACNWILAVSKAGLQCNLAIV